jgi:hypothetical protein
MCIFAAIIHSKSYKMNKDIKEILPSVGLGKLRFGMTRDEVRSLLGEPSDIENVPGFEEEHINDELESWHYDESEFSLVFDSAYDWRAVSIAVSDPFFTLFGEQIIGSPKDKVIALLSSKGYEVTATEDLPDEEIVDLKLYEFEELGMMLWSTGEEVIELQILPDVEEDGETIKWPS